MRIVAAFDSQTGRKYKFPVFRALIVESHAGSDTLRDQGPAVELKKDGFKGLIVARYNRKSIVPVPESPGGGLTFS